MPLYRCYFCTNEKGLPGRDFEADKPVCPDCGADRSQPRMTDRVVALETIHFHPPSKRVGVGLGHLACSPGTKFPDPKSQVSITATGEPHLVNCPQCRASPLFAAGPAPVVTPEGDYLLQAVTEK